MSKKLTKLARAKAKTKANDKLNNSDEDFQPVVKEANLEKVTIVKEEVSSSANNSDVSLNSTLLQKCHFCGKTFKEGQELARISHLKTCGSNLGVGTGDLLKIRQLEERQAEEWKALNLPKAVNQSRNKTVSRSRVKSTLYSCDANLEMALALSASLVDQGAPKTIEEGPKSVASECWLPQAPEKISKKVPKSKAKTILEVRTEVERSKQITEAVMQILSSEIIASFCTSKYDMKSGTQSKLLMDLQCSNCLWKAAAMDKTFNFCLEFFRPFKRQDCEASKAIECVDDEKEDTKMLRDDLNGVTNDWSKLLKSGKRADLRIITKGEQEIKAHSLVLFARCPSLLNAEHLIEEEGSCSVLSWLEVSKSAAMSFLAFIYSGQMSIAEEDLNDGKLLAKKCPELTKWSQFVSIGEKGHNLSALLEILEEEEELSEKSADLFEDSQQQSLSRPMKRKSSVVEDEGLSKRSRLEDPEGSFEDLLYKNATVYSRRFSSPIDDLLLDVQESSVTKSFKFKPEHRNAGEEKENYLGNGMQSFDKKECDDPDHNKLIVSRGESERESRLNETLSQSAREICELSNGFSTPIPKSSHDKSGGFDLELENYQSDFDKSELSLDQSRSGQAEIDKQEPGGDGSPSDFDRSYQFIEEGKFHKTEADEEPDNSEIDQRDAHFQPISVPQGTKFVMDDSDSSPEKGQVTTPMPNYETMLSPALRVELKKFGLKVIPRRKAVPLLKHIFQETHPECRRQVEFAQDEMSSSQESQSEEVLEESLALVENDVRSSEDLSSQLLQFIKDDPHLHRQALMYEPIWLEDLVVAFKDKTSAPAKQAQIMDILDIECITFRTRSQNDKNKKRNARK